MTNKNNSEFDWDKFMRFIDRKNVIPVIGKQLYRVDINSNSISEKDYPLYKYFTEVVSNHCTKQLSTGENQKFLVACHKFLKERDDDRTQLSEILKEQFKETSLNSTSPLWNFARIKKFNFFMTTAYDNLLTQVLEEVRTSPTVTLSYTVELFGKC